MHLNTRSIVSDIDGLPSGEEEFSRVSSSTTIKLKSKFKSDKSEFVHDLEYINRANGAMAAKFRFVVIFIYSRSTE